MRLLATARNPSSNRSQCRLAENLRGWSPGGRFGIPHYSSVVSVARTAVSRAVKTLGPDTTGDELNRHYPFANLCCG